MNTSSLKINSYEKFNTNILALTANIKKVESTLAQIEILVNSITNNWKGDASSTYLSNYKALVSQKEQLFAALKFYSDNYNKAYTELMTAEEENSGNI